MRGEVDMFAAPVLSKHIRVRLHWGDSTEELEQEVNGNLEAFPNIAVYSMDYRISMAFGADGKLNEKHCMAVFFRP